MRLCVCLCVAQIVLAIGQVEWTRDAEQAIHSGGAKGLAQYAKDLQEQLGRTVEVLFTELCLEVVSKLVLFSLFVAIYRPCRV